MKTKTKSIVGTNVEWSMDGTVLVLRVETAVKGEESNSGKTMIVASTQGNKKLDDVFVGLNVYRYKDSKKGKK